MKICDIRNKCDYCSIRSCGKRVRKFYPRKHLPGVIVGCARWKPTHHAISLFNQIINR